MEFSQIIMSTSFVELDGVRDHKNMDISSGDRERVYLKTESMHKRIQAEIKNGNKETSDYLR